MPKCLLLLLACFFPAVCALGELDLIGQFTHNRSTDEDEAVIGSLSAAQINAQVDADGQTALFYCRHLGATMLLLAGANPNIRDHAGRTAAFRAVSGSGDVAYLIRSCSTCSCWRAPT